MKKNRIIFLLISVLGGFYFANGQDLLQILDEEREDTLQYTQATFKANQIIYGQSVETRKKGTLEFLLGTRYWNIPNNENRKSFVADRFSGRLGLQYAFTDRFTAGFGVTSFDGVVNAFGKYRLVRQRDDNNKSPIGITLFQGTSMLTRDFSGVLLPQEYSDRFSFVSQVIFARKFDRNLSLQVAPMYIHTNAPQLAFTDNDFFVLGLGGRYKLSNHVSLVTEYHYVAGREEGVQGFNPFAIGINWEVSDVILQFSLTNTKSFDETAIILYTPNNFNFNDGGLHFGVNATYVLHLNKKKKGKLKK